jgi:ParB family chromosome partitioning protein
MATKKRGLGRGLNALLAGAQPAVTADVSEATAESAVRFKEELRTLPVDVLQRGQYQPRMDMHPESLEELAESIKAQGVVQPIVVRPLATDGRYEIIAGERRWRASQLAGLDEIPVVVRDVPDETALAMALIENIQREGLNPLEEARALQRLADEFELTHQEVAQAVGRSRAGVSNLLRLLDLNEEVKRMLEHGDLEMGHARALLALRGTAQSEAARRVVARGLSVRETENLVRQLQQPAKRKSPGPSLDPDIRKLQDDLSEKLGASVRIQHGSRGKGKLVIQYNSLDELDGVLAHIN